MLHIVATVNYTVKGYDVLPGHGCCSLRPDDDRFVECCGGVLISRAKAREL